MGGCAARIFDPDTEDIASAGLKPVALCIECNRFSLSEIIICKGVRNPKHKGWRYQIVSDQTKNIKESTAPNLTSMGYGQCLYFSTYSRMSPLKAKERERESQVQGLKPDASYRPCSRFVWLEKHPRAPTWWVDQATGAKGGGKSIKCPGVRCLQKSVAEGKEMSGRKPKDGNKLCTNGGLCRECCDVYQRGDFLPDCGYAPHNYTKKLEQVSPAPRELRTQLN